jgi:hypothetical protein
VLGRTDGAARKTVAARTGSAAGQRWLKAASSNNGHSGELSSVTFGTAVHVLTHVEYEIEPAVEVVASVRYPHQQFGLE